MSRLSNYKKTKFRRLIKQGLENNTFTINSFVETHRTDRKTIIRLINDSPNLKKFYRTYKGKIEHPIPKQKKAKADAPFVEEVSKDYNHDKGTGVITTKSLNITTVEEALRIAEVDTKIWEVERFIINSWEVTIGGKNSGTDKSETYTNFQVKIWLKRYGEEVLAAKEIYELLKKGSPVVPIINYKLSKPKNERSRELELSLADIHLGLRCFSPSSTVNWTPEDAEKMTMQVLDGLIRLSKTHGPYKRIIFPMGNDLLHCDNVYGETTSRTLQPEADAWQNTFLRGERLVLAMVERMKEECPVKVIVVAGNHARHSEIALGRILSAYYHNDKNITVDAELAPYKFHKFGLNLIGFEHGHSIRNTLRLVGLMANETRINGWEEARYCEWHLGDQHRKGSGRPSIFAEQGVSIEFLPGLVPPNEWHVLHAFNWQKRAGMSFVWDQTAGPVARFQVNIDNYSGEILR